MRISTQTIRNLLLDGGCEGSPLVRLQYVDDLLGDVPDNDSGRIRYRRPDYCAPQEQETCAPDTAEHSETIQCCDVFVVHEDVLCTNAGTINSGEMNR